MSKEVVLEVHREDIKRHIETRMNGWGELEKDDDFIKAFERMNDKLPHKLEFEDIGFRLANDTELYLNTGIERDYLRWVTLDKTGYRFKKRTAYHDATKEVVAMAREYFKDFNYHLLLEMFGLGIAKRIHRTKSDKRYFIICNTEGQFGNKLKIPEGLKKIKFSEYYQIVEADEND